MAQTVALIGSREACRILGVDRSTLTRWVQAGRLYPAGRLEGGAYLFDPTAIEALAVERAS